MLDNGAVLAIIPARGGSKGLPGKNIKTLHGKPLIGWTIEKAKISKYIDIVMVSTDDMQIANVAKQFGAEVPFLRPSRYATDTASTYDVIRHTIDYYKEVLSLDFKYTVLLEPTSPLREDGDIDRTLSALNESEAEFDSAVTVGMVTEHPAVMKKISCNRITPYYKDIKQKLRRQDNEPAFYPYGVVYAAKTSELIKENTFYTERCMGIPIKRYQNYEIDDIYDFYCVEAVMRNEWGLK